MGNNLVSYDNVVMLMAPQDIAGTATASTYLDLKTANDCMIYVMVGGITASADQTAGPVITIQASTAAASNATETNYEFLYRLSGAVESNTWTAPASATAGVDLTVNGDNKILAIKVDPAGVAALGADFRYVRVVVTPGTGGDTCLVSVMAAIDTRYKQTTFVSAT
ncbi:MAG TPA: hypothetical protein PKJ34_12655 [Anaerolineaceae bacterium]|nr:hypothetical protein [Anaerolineaceae bacterium]